MIRHIVLTKFTRSTSEETIADIYAGLSALTETLDGAQKFTGGRSDSPENLERGYRHGFTIDFDSWQVLRTYAEHPVHQSLGQRLVENAVGGIDGILVLDIEV